MTSTTQTDQTDLTVTSGDYTLDSAHSRLGFVARHAMITKVRGEFADFTGSAHVDAENPENSSVNLSIDASTVSTGNADRDGHLTSPDFFDVATHPQWTFASTAVRRAGSTWSITGDLRIKGIAKPVTIDFEETGAARDPFGNDRVGFEGQVVVNRKDWDLTWNAALETGGVLVSEKVTLEFDLSAIRNPA